ncbi:DUF6394 family protein [Candidatus Marithrix sp. Canyon 246]|uniref:DUF6394 family protein n=1 Tax=Candidatus Marithrix sp. Canyon 246 TaxID=1827136 RepID=UPI000849F3BB|nr:DUF6394 family protein [Candidatus Marithrix sp. Canyon 246]
MNLEKIAFGFFIVLALTLNFGFFIGDMADVKHHNVYELAMAIVVNLFATILKFGDRTQVGALLLATSLVANLQLIVAAMVWYSATHVGSNNLVELMPSIVSLAGGAMLANVISVLLIVIDTAMLRR